MPRLSKLSTKVGPGPPPAVPPLVERFDRRGTEPFELFRSEFGQNSWNPKKTTKSHLCQVAARAKPTRQKRQQTTHFSRRGRRKTEKRKPAATRGDLSQAVRTREENMHKAICSEEARRTTRNYPRVRARSRTASKDEAKLKSLNVEK